MDKSQPHPLFKIVTEIGPMFVFFGATAISNL